jgi:hypothetical protein
MPDACLVTSDLAHANPFADQARDPSLHQALAHERRRDDLGVILWRRHGAHAESRPVVRTEAERLDAARCALALAASAEHTPGARFRRALAEIEARLTEAAPLLDAARAAAARDFDAERALCADRARRLHALARALRDLALDAATTAEG